MRRVLSGSFLVAVVLIQFTAAARSARGQPVPDYGFEWATITHPGNRAATEEEAPEFFPPWSQPAIHAGSVGYEYRISVKEVTTAQYFEFVQAYAPYTPTAWSDPQFYGRFITPNGPPPTPEGHTTYRINGDAGEYPATMGWRFAARFANWLHNGKVNEPWAFESGVYDTSTFTRNADGTFNDQRVPSPGARFWIPSLDEWVKAVYFDPNRYGPGEEGYWLYPNGTDTPLVPGWPEEGGQTGAGIEYPFEPGDELRYLPVGSYPQVRSPWGLLDTSGGVSEYLGRSATEGELLHHFARLKGSRHYVYQHEMFDRIDWFGTSGVFNDGGGLRLASAIPSPSILAVLGGVGAWAVKRRRRERWDARSGLS